MLTIEHCDEIHIHLPADRETILTQSIATALRQTARHEEAAGVDAVVRTSATPPALGEFWPGQGGHYVGTMPARDGKPGYHLVLAKPQNASIKFGPYDHDVNGAADHYDGHANTAALAANAKDHPAAKWAEAVTEEGHSDFYLPAHNELMLMWICAPQLFEKQGWYWSSTQYSPSLAWVQDFECGYSCVSIKDNELRAVAVRRLVL
jgi:hypothetical protein